MTDGDRDSSGELSSFLHLTGWRPAILALFAGVAGAIGLFLALGEPTEWQARYIINCNNVASEDFIPAELDIFCEEIAQTAQFPVVLAEVTRQTGLVEEDDYEIVVRQSASSPAIVDVNVVSLNPTEAQSVAIETAIAAIENSLEKRVNGLESLRDQLDAELQAADLRVSELTREAGGLNPSTAYNRAQNDLLDRYAFLNNPSQIEELDDEGNILDPGGVDPDVMVEARRYDAWRVEEMWRLRDERAPRRYVDEHFEANKALFFQLADPAGEHGLVFGQATGELGHRRHGPLDSFSTNPSLVPLGHQTLQPRLGLDLADLQRLSPFFESGYTNLKLGPSGGDGLGPLLQGGS